MWNIFHFCSAIGATLMQRLKTTFLNIILYGLGSYFFISIFLRNINFIDSIRSEYVIDSKYSNANGNITLSYPSTKLLQGKYFSKNKRKKNLYRIKSNSNIIQLSRQTTSSFESSTQITKIINKMKYPIATNEFKVLSTQNNFSPVTLLSLTLKNKDYSSQNTKQFDFLSSNSITQLPSLFSTPMPTATAKQPSHVKTICHKYSNLVEMTQKNNPPVYTYSNISVLLKPLNQAPESKPTFMLVGILSNPEDRDFRDAVRETWGSSSLLISLNR